MDRAITFIQNVSPNLARVCFDSQLEMYNPEKQIMEMHEPILARTPKLEGSILAINSNGEVQMVEIDENRRSKARDFRIKTNKLGFTRRTVNPDEFDKHYQAEPQSAFGAPNKLTLNRIRSQPEFSNQFRNFGRNAQVFQTRYVGTTPSVG